jgi:hypothetical protein
MADEEFDLQLFAKLFDAAISSDNPAVKKALRNFMMVASIVEAEDLTKERTCGPLTNLLEKMDAVTSRVRRIEHEMSASVRGTASYYDHNYTTRFGPVYNHTGASVSSASASTSNTFNTILNRQEAEDKIKKGKI